MLNKQLKVGDYVVSADGTLYRITKVSKASYSYVNIERQYDTGFVPFNGIRKTGYWDNGLEVFYCDDAQAQVFINLKKKFELATKLEKSKEEIKELLGRAKYILSQINDIEIVEVDEEDEEVIEEEDE